MKDDRDWDSEMRVLLGVYHGELGWYLLLPFVSGIERIFFWSYHVTSILKQAYQHPGDLYNKR